MFPGGIVNYGYHELIEVSIPYMIIKRQETMDLEITSNSFYHLLMTDSEAVGSLIDSGRKIAPDRMAMKYGAYGIRKFDV